MAVVAPPPATTPHQPRERRRLLARFFDWLDPWTWPLVALLLPILVRLLTPLFLTDSTDWAYQCGRAAGYLGAGFLLLPYLYFLRRQLLNWRLVNAQRWIFWHIAFAFLAFGTILVHINFRLSKSAGAMTSWIMLLFALVMLSGILGLLGQKVLFRLLDHLIIKEYGPEGLERERERLAGTSALLVRSWSLLTVNDVRDWEQFVDAIMKVPTLSGPKGFPEPARRAIVLIRARRHSAEHLQQVIDALNEFIVRTEGVFCPKAKLDECINKVRAERLTKGLPREIKRWQRWLKHTESLTAPPDIEERYREAFTVSRRARLYLEYLCDECLQESEPAPDYIEGFYRDAIEPELKAPFTFWQWLIGGRRQSPLAENLYRRVQAMAPPAHQGMVEQLWLWLRQRRAMDREYRLHRIARLWVGAHSIAAWLLFVLVADHIVASIRYGGL